MADTWNPRFDVSEPLEAAGWVGDADNPLEIFRKGPAVWAVTSDCGDSQLGVDGWDIGFPSDVPAVVIVATCLAAAGATPAPAPVESAGDETGEAPVSQPDDNRHRLYIDGKGNGWISTCVEDGVEHVVPVQPAAWVEASIDEVAAETGGLREIGRCW